MPDEPVAVFCALPKMMFGVAGKLRSFSLFCMEVGQSTLPKTVNFGNVLGCGLEILLGSAVWDELEKSL